MNCEIITSGYFNSEAKRLAKRYNSFKDDLIELRHELEQNPLLGTEIAPNIRKIRMKISSKGRGKSGGARVITYTTFISENNLIIALLTIYDKADASNVKTNVIKQIIKDLGL